MDFKQRQTMPVFAEFVALMAMMLALPALSTDAMLPALPQIGRELAFPPGNSTQLIVSFLFLGMAAGQLFYGPVSDSVGRKPTIYVGYLIFISGCLLSILAPNYVVMLSGRLLQGVGIAGPRSVTLALIRDQFEGRQMARVMSFVMAVFILVPAIAPSVGQIVLLLANWRAIFSLLLTLALITVTWFWQRQPETLPLDKRSTISGGRLWGALREVLFNRSALGYTLAAGAISGAFLGYLNSAQQIFQDIYGLGRRFPLFFALVALAIGGASALNGRLVTRFGMRFLTSRAVSVLLLLSTIFLGFAWFITGTPALALFLLYLMIAFFCVGILFGNLNSLAMEPLGRVAGIGAAVVGALSTFISVPLGIVIGQNFNMTVLPLVTGFTVLGGLAGIIIWWVERPNGD